MGELVFIGFGLDDERGITLRGLDEARAADMVFAEFYTSALRGASIEAVEKLIDRQIRRLSRKEVEDGQVLLAAAANGTVAFLVPGDPMSATTHVDLRLRAEAAKIRTRIVHGVSILTAAAGALGLQAYKFGRTTTVPFPSPGFAPTSPLEAILENRRAGLHTLVLLDLREDGSFLAPRDAIASLLRIASAIGTSDFGPQTLDCVPVDLLGYVPLRRVRPLIQLVEDRVGQESLVERAHRHDEVGFQESGQVLLVDPGVGPIMPGSLDERVVFPFD